MLYLSTYYKAFFALENYGKVIILILYCLSIIYSVVNVYKKQNRKDNGYRVAIELFYLSRVFRIAASHGAVFAGFSMLPV